MAIESPLFQSALELFSHSISHFNGSKELDRKLVILHLANAVELILKDLVLDSGESIYKNPKETITIHSCINILSEKNIYIPYLNRMELLFDERNALQHRFGSPNELTTIFYMNIVQEFFKEILFEHYDQDYEEVITQFVDEKELHIFNMREPKDEAELDNLKKLANIHPMGALLAAMAYLEKTIIEFASNIGLEEEFRRRSFLSVLSYRQLERYGIRVPEELRDKMDDTRRLRNLVAHGRKEPTKIEVKDAISSIEQFEQYLSSIDIERAKAYVEGIIEEQKFEEERRKAKFKQVLEED